LFLDLIRFLIDYSDFQIMNRYFKLVDFLRSSIVNFSDYNLLDLKNKFLMVFKGYYISTLAISRSSAFYHQPVMSDRLWKILFNHLKIFFCKLYSQYLLQIFKFFQFMINVKLKFENILFLVHILRICNFFF